MDLLQLKENTAQSIAPFVKAATPETAVEILKRLKVKRWSAESKTPKDSEACQVVRSAFCDALTEIATRNGQTELLYPKAHHWALELSALPVQQQTTELTKSLLKMFAAADIASYDAAATLDLLNELAWSANHKTFLALAVSKAIQANPASAQVADGAKPLLKKIMRYVDNNSLYQVINETLERLVTHHPTEKSFAAHLNRLRSMRVGIDPLDRVAMYETEPLSKEQLNAFGRKKREKGYHRATGRSNYGAELD